MIVAFPLFRLLAPLANVYFLDKISHRSSYLYTILSKKGL